MPIPGLVAIFGNGQNGAAIALRKVFDKQDEQRRILVLDYAGRGAMLLDSEHGPQLPEKGVAWHDMADRRCPVALLHLRQFSHFRQVLSRVLANVCVTARVALMDSTLAWAVEAAWQLAKSGSVGLGAVLRSFSSPEMRGWFMNTQSHPADLGKLLEAIRWALQFPAVFDISEGINRADLHADITHASVTWVEIRIEYFEPCEYSLVTTLVEAAVEEALRGVAGKQESSGELGVTLTVLHLFPPAIFGPRLPEWIGETASVAKHIGVHKLQADKAPSPFLSAWANEAESIWLVGKVGVLSKKAHGCWLSEEEITLVSNLDDGDLWCRSLATGKEVTAKVRHADEQLATANRCRRGATQKLKIATVRQSSSVAADINFASGHAGLYQELTDIRTLHMGWQRVKKNGWKKSRGVDGVTIPKFRDNFDQELNTLAHELKTGKYRCRPARRVLSAKPDGRKRELAVCCVRDRVVMSACLLLLGPIFEPLFSQSSFAFRAHRSPHHALAAVRRLIDAGRPWAVIADIKKCFDTVDHDLVLELVAQQVNDHELLQLIRHWLTIAVMDFKELFPVSIGVPQGESLSPLLANIYLDQLDKHFEMLGIDFVRFADDIIILSPDEDGAVKALQVMKDFLAKRLHLELQPAKTYYVPVVDGFDFLGFRFQPKSWVIRQKKITAVLDFLGEWLALLGNPASTVDQQVSALVRLNAIIRGFRNYFSLSEEPFIDEQLRGLDASLEQAALYHLPESTRKDPAWVCRERFFLARSLDDIETATEANKRKGVVNGTYADGGSSSSLPAAWMLDSRAIGEAEDASEKRNTPVEGEAEDSGEEVKPTMAFISEGDKLYVLTHGVYLSVSSDDELVIKRKRVEIHRCPLNGLGLLFLQGYGITVSVNLQVRFAELDIALVCALPTGEEITVLSPFRSGHALLRSRQVLRRDASDVIRVGLQMIAAKIGNQAAVLQYFFKYRKKTDQELAGRMRSTAKEIQHLAEQVRHLDPAAAQVRQQAMGFEGRAASLYWQQAREMLPPDLGFHGRVTRGAADVVNQCLNYLYGIVYSEVWRALAKAGLDPYFGILHGSIRDQGSLVFDMIEEFRSPFVDRMVFAMLGRGFLPTISKLGSLNMKSKRILIASFTKRWKSQFLWRSRKLTPGALLLHQANSLAKLYRDEGDYHPYRMRW